MPYDESNLSKGQQDIKFFLTKMRDIPKDDPAVSEALRMLLFGYEAQYRSGAIKRADLKIYCEYFKERFGVHYVIIDNRNVVFIPLSNYVYRAFTEYPKVLLIVGHRHGGKTVTAWTILQNALKNIDCSEAWIYGDVDGMVEIMDGREPFKDRIIARDSYDLPRIDRNKRILLFNEVPPDLFASKHATKQASNYKARIFRARHSYNWIIFNLIREADILGTIREGEDIKIFKRLTSTQLYKLKETLPKAFYEIVKMCSSKDFPVNLGLAVVSLPAGGLYFHIVNIKASSDILNASNTGIKQTEIMQDDFIPLEKKVIKKYNQMRKGKRVFGVRTLKSDLSIEGFTIGVDKIRDILYRARAKGLIWPTDKEINEEIEKQGKK